MANIVTGPRKRLRCILILLPIFGILVGLYLTHKRDEERTLHNKGDLVRIKVRPNYDKEDDIKPKSNLLQGANQLLSLQSRIRLSSGYSMPILGFGVYMAYGEDVVNSVHHALKTGYRLIDSAALYRNEREAGLGIKNWLRETAEARREDIFYTSKIWDSDQGYSSTKKAIERSLSECDLGYIDLYLIHSPYPGRKLRLETWKAMEEAVAEGKVRSIGVSNYGVKHLEELARVAKILPAVNQIEAHPFISRIEIIEYCQKHNITVEAFCPITRGQKFSDPRVQSLAAKHDKTPAQVMLRWSIQKGMVPLPKSIRDERIEENSRIFDFKLDDDDMATLTTDEYYVVDWDPTTSM
ncbi:glyoxal reductase [Dipodascopsis uninucleata]